MAGERFDDEIKVRFPGDLKKRVEALANARYLTVSDLVREALKAYADAAEAIPKEEAEVAR